MAGYQPHRYTKAAPPGLSPSDWGRTFLPAVLADQDRSETAMMVFATGPTHPAGAGLGSGPSDSPGMTNGDIFSRHCERSEAIHLPARQVWICFVAIASRNDEFDRLILPGGQITSDFPKLCQARFAKIFLFSPDPNQFTDSHCLVPTRGAYRDRHERGAGCGGRGSARDERGLHARPRAHCAPGIPCAL